MWFLENVVGQARTLTDAEFAWLIDQIQHHPHADRNTMMLKMLYGAGMRVGEIAELLVSDVVNVDGSIRDQIILQPHQTKGCQQRIVYLNEKLRIELAYYLMTVDRAGYLFKTQKRDHFTDSTLQAVVTSLCRRVGLVGCSSDSG